MNGFLHWFVIALTLANIFGCWWLIRWAGKRRPGDVPDGEKMSHSWDDGDLIELNNPMPRWWLGMFYATIIFSLIYLALYPGLGNFKGFFNWTQEAQYEKEMAEAKETYGPIFAKYAQQDIETVSKDTGAKEIGQRLFINYCASCHGSDAGGAPGFPSLKDKDWLWGGSPDAIKKTILDGRQGVMPAWKAVLGDDGVGKVAAYVASLSGRNVNPSQATAGKSLYNTNCAACHMATGTGNPALGAPNLTDKVWLYGGSLGAIKKTISNGRNGIMPSHRDFLGEDKVHLLAAYIYSLSAD